MDFHVLASGSKGNANLVRTKNTAILIDCGTTGKYLKTKLSELDMTIDDLDAVLITHTHSDHIKGIKAVADVALYAPCEIKQRTNELLVRPYEAFTIGDIDILPVKTSHDAPESVGYILTSGEEKLVHITDTGYISQNNLAYMRDADYYIFEANHDVDMLMDSSRPAYLKARILSDMGHMNNRDAGNVLSLAIGPRTRSIVLAHLSEECNTPELALDTVRQVFAENGVSLQNISLQAAPQFGVVSGGQR